MADADNELTPEKRLLQLIEGGRTDAPSPEAGTAVKKPGIADRFKQYLSPEGLKALLAETKESLLSITQGRKEFFNLKGVNRAAKVFTVLLAFYLGFTTFYDIQVGNQGFIDSLQVPAREVTDIELSDTRVFDTNLLNEQEKLVVFTPYSKREQKQEAEEKDEMSLKLVALIKDWKLAGISIYPQNPSRTFCMIEDLQKNTTTFLKVGDQISGLKVDQINPDSVILRFNQETIELR